MSLPRRVVPARTHLITRRCTQRMLLLTPSRTINHLLRYALGTSLRRHDMRLLAAVVSSNHYHLVVEDPQAKLPDFVRDFDQLVARALNTHYGRGENFWAVGSYSNVEIFDAESLVEKLLYVWTNPVKDGLVERPEQWPGLSTGAEDMGRLRVPIPRPETAFFGGRRPAGREPTYQPRAERLRRARRGRRRPPQPGRAAYQGKASSLPEFSLLEVARPSLLAEYELDELHGLLERALEERVQEIHAARRAAGRTDFMGPDRVRNQSPFQSAGDVFPDFGLDPRIAPGRDLEIAKERVHELLGWRSAHRVSLEAWRNGRRKVRFPYGTYAMRVYHGARVEDPRSGAPPPLLAA